MEKLNFLTENKARAIRKEFGSPLYVYDEKSLINQAKEALKFPNAYGLCVRYAMKASSNKNILHLFDKQGLHIDASSGYEVQRAILAGIDPKKISLSSQLYSEDLKDFHKKGVLFNACSIYQLKQAAKDLPKGAEIGVRINPGLGSGGTSKTNVGGPASSFGIWNEYLDEVLSIANKAGLKIVRLHTHIGSGSDPKVWQKVAIMSLDTVAKLPDVKVLDMGGGFKVGRMDYEKSTDLQKIGLPVKKAFEAFAKKTGRKIKLEIEPGTFLVAKSACLVSTVEDMCSTGKDGYDFIKLNIGMPELLRPSLYGSQHPIVIVNKKALPACKGKKNAKAKCPVSTNDYVVVGKCCESGDLISPLPDDPNSLGKRTLQTAQIGDICVVEGAGAYCSAMSTINYNSYPQCAEVMLEKNGKAKLIRKAQTLKDIIKREI